MRLYTKAYRKVFERVAGGTYRAGINTAVITEAELERLSSGAYYISIRAVSGTDIHERRETVLIIKK